MSNNLKLALSENTIETRLKEKKEFFKNNKSDEKIVIIGSGAFGTSLANVFSRQNNNVLIYGIDKKEVKDINENHKNSKYFSKKLPNSVTASTDIKEVLEGAKVIILAIPSHVFDLVLREQIVVNMDKPAYFVSVAKGIDNLKTKFLTTIIEEIVPDDLRLGVLKLAGPSFAQELMYNVPTIFTLASKDIEVAKKVSKYFITDVTDIEITSNIFGTELVSILKNPLAILLGIVTGLGYGYNTRARIFLDSIREIETIMDYFKLDKSIIHSPAGIGDLYLTGSSKKSRNFSVGHQIGRMNKVNKRILSSFTTIEGLRSIELIMSFAIKNNIEVNLFKILYNITYNKSEPKEIISNYLKGIK